jgi:hypothetical protein
MTSPHQIIQNAIDNVLMKPPLFPEGPEVRLERLQFDAHFFWDISDSNRGKIGLARKGTETGKLGTFQADLVVSAWSRIGKGVQLFASRCRHKITSNRQKLTPNNRSAMAARLDL